MCNLISAVQGETKFRFDSVGGSVLPDLGMRMNFVSLNLNILSFFVWWFFGFVFWVFILQGHFYFHRKA